MQKLNKINIKHFKLMALCILTLFLILSEKSLHSYQGNPYWLSSGNWITSYNAGFIHKIELNNDSLIYILMIEANESHIARIRLANITSIKQQHSGDKNMQIDYYSVPESPIKNKHRSIPNEPILKIQLDTFGKYRHEKTNQNYMFLSLKGGYHTENEPNIQWGFTAGWVTNISAGVTIANKWEFGLNVDFWRSSNDNYPISNNITYKRDYKADGVSLMFKYTIPLNKKLLVFKIGMEFGNYRISAKSLDGFFDAEQYFNIGATINMEIKTNSFLSIETEATYNNLIGFNQPNHFLKFTIGPKLLLKIN